MFRLSALPKRCASVTAPVAAPLAPEPGLVREVYRQQAVDHLQRPGERLGPRGEQKAQCERETDHPFCPVRPGVRRKRGSAAPPAGRVASLRDGGARTPVQMRLPCRVAASIARPCTSGWWLSPKTAPRPRNNGVVGASRRSPVRWRCDPLDCGGEPPLARTMEMRSAGLWGDGCPTTSQ